MTEAEKTLQMQCDPAKALERLRGVVASGRGLLAGEGGWLIEELERARRERVTVQMPPMPESELIDHLRKLLEDAYRENARLKLASNDAYRSGYNAALRSREEDEELDEQK